MGWYPSSMSQGDHLSPASQYWQVLTLGSKERPIARLVTIWPPFVLGMSIGKLAVLHLTDTHPQRLTWVSWLGVMDLGCRYSTPE